jgi:hypothetical protein
MTSDSPRLRALLVSVLGACAVAPSLAQSDAPAEPPPASASAIAVPAAPGAPVDVVAEDTPNDDGRSLIVRWSPGDASESLELRTEYRVLRTEAGSEPVEAGVVARIATSFADPGVEPGRSYRYTIAAVGPGGESRSAPSNDAIPRGQWFDRTRTSVLLIMLVVCLAIWINILRAQRGEKLYIRKIAGMDAVTEAVGRATEMGKPVLYIAGLQDMDNVQTVAGITILGSISKMVAEYETQLLMPTSRSLVMSTARETVKEAYLSAGRPDAYREDSIYYVTDEQFGFVAHVDGLMLRKRPATCFYLGAFFAESLILAETGNSIGAIQVAGTAMPTQLPFFVAACDYTLIGEELFAASAYLSKDEKMLGSLKGQDFGKLLAMICVAAGSLLATTAALWPSAAVASLNDALQWLWSGGS